jgi:hypothetical protein
LTEPASPPEPDLLLAEYRRLRDDSAAPASAWDDLAKRARSAKAAWKKAGDRARALELAVLQDYIAQSKPRDESAALDPEQLRAEIRALRAAAKDKRTKGRVLALWRRLEATRATRAAGPFARRRP